MAKLIRNTNLAAAFLLALLVCFVFDAALAQYIVNREVCDRLSQTLKGTCTDNKECRNACWEEEGPVLSGACAQTALSIDEEEFDKCLKKLDTTIDCSQDARRTVMDVCVCFVPCSPS